MADTEGSAERCTMVPRCLGNCSSLSGADFASRATMKSSEYLIAAESIATGQHAAKPDHAKAVPGLVGVAGAVVELCLQDSPRCFRAWT